MSKLIDELVATSDYEKEYVDGKWYIAKPLNRKGFWSRLKDAFAVLIGSSQAFHYFEDSTKCTRTGYELCKCTCEKCIELDKRRKKING